ncbi:hypothetical protein F5144DRAFT_588113 [Chaetomium tenue]|uniref:Uncharacterized protein n=1 Tax=Chaetomium tenue TaxID=1854479 RepID=A0ACB7PJZ0_9PEZI|nr:hypothetical protein F5144DRAFT_588113 [Chaetomium globosum]
MKTIGIFPASGGLGESTYTHLLRLVRADTVILISRHPDKTPHEHIQAGVQTRQADYTQSPAELEAAFTGIDVLFLISYPSHQHELRTKLQLPAIDAAHRAGVSHLIYSSLAFANSPDGHPSNTSVAEVMGAHLDSEAHLASLATSSPSTFTYTVIREGLYSESTPIYTAFFNPRTSKDNEILIPHDGGGRGVSWVKRDELGEATARIIARCVNNSEGFAARGWVNGRVVLMGPREWSLGETVKVLGEVAGRSGEGGVRIREVGADEYVRQPQVLGVFGREELARTWATAFEAVKRGETGAVTRDLEEILGRRPEEFDVTVKGYWGGM